MRAESATPRQKTPFTLTLTRQSHQLRVLTPELAEDLASFNSLARELVRLGVPILSNSFTGRVMELAGQEAVKAIYGGQFDVDEWSFQKSAGGCHTSVRCRGVRLKWFEPAITRPIGEVLR